MAKRSAEEEAARYLTSRMRTEEELRKHLAGKGYQAGEVEAALSEYRDLGYLNDYEYALRYAEMGFRKLRGVRRVVLELKERGVDTETARNACEDVLFEQGLDERTNARAAAEKTLQGEKFPPEQRALARVARKLEQLGYSGGLIAETLSAVRAGGPEEDGEEPTRSPREETYGLRK